jgi:hypothetical protein
MNNDKIEFYSQSSTNKGEGRRRFTLVMILVIIVFNLLTFLYGSTLEPGAGMVLFPLIPFIWASWLIIVGFFIELAIRYSREKSSMHYLDKILFYVLALPIISIGVYFTYRVYSENTIQNLLNDRQEKIDKKMAGKQKGPADLVIKDIYANSEMATIKFCNESENATGEKVAIKIETDKGFSDIIENYPSLQPGECESAQMFNNYLKLKKGDSVRITATLDPKNKISETNKENNKMIKDFNL